MKHKLRIVLVGLMVSVFSQATFAQYAASVPQVEDVELTTAIKRDGQHVTNVGKTQIGNGIDAALIHIHLKIVFHSLSPRFTKNWAQSPVKVPVKILITIITGRYSSSDGVFVSATATHICPTEWAIAPIAPATQICFSVSTCFRPMVTRIAAAPPPAE